MSWPAAAAELATGTSTQHHRNVLHDAAQRGDVEALRRHLAPVLHSKHDVRGGGRTRLVATQSTSAGAQTRADGRVTHRSADARAFDFRKQETASGAGARWRPSLGDDVSDDVQALLLQEDNHGNIPAHLAAKFGGAECLAMLLQAGFGSRQALTPHGHTGGVAAHAAVWSGNVECLAVLMALPESPHVDVFGVGNDEERRLLRWKQLEALDNEGYTPLHRAVCCGHAACTALVLQASRRCGRGAGDTKKLLLQAARDGFVPVHTAAWAGDEKNLRVLLDHGQGDLLGC